uniref:Endoglucanase n=1 Tax=Leersia perrieri TaxID=77586 RepID=A0A0D9VCA9_9ORYZ
MQLLVEEKHLTSNQRTVLEKFRSNAEYYVCSCMNLNPGGAAHNAGRTPAGLLFIRPWNNLQYVSNAAFLLAVHSDTLSSLPFPLLLCPGDQSTSNSTSNSTNSTSDSTNSTPNSTNSTADSTNSDPDFTSSPPDSTNSGPDSTNSGVDIAATAEEVMEFAKSQADYILGTNPMNTSYLVGYGEKYPRRVHHRAASSASYRVDKEFIGCLQGFDSWYSAGVDNPNDLVGAVVGGPNARDVFTDHRGAYMQTEACTYNTAPMVGVFSKLMEMERRRRRWRPEGGDAPPSSGSPAAEEDDL